MHTMMAATDGIPLNFAFTGKANDSGEAGLEDQVRNGAVGLKLHEVRLVLVFAFFPLLALCSALRDRCEDADAIPSTVAPFRLHLPFSCSQDWGSTPAAIDSALSLAEKYDVQVNIHSDTLNESGFVQDTIDAFKGRTIHAYHMCAAPLPRLLRSISLLIYLSAAAKEPGAFPSSNRPDPCESFAVSLPFLPRFFPLT